MPHADYLNLTALADVVLDPFHFGCGVTAYDALAVGKPIVTWPSAYQRGRYVLGCYRKMGVLDAVAQSPLQYAQIALRLGTDPAYRNDLSQRLHAAADVLFDDLDAVRRHEAFFDQAIAAGRQAAS
jgi:predicted O-linked N-acetylglucosamine transferase (SPINDLY family)